MELQPRQYQKEAVDAVNCYLKTEKGNPCVELPTGSGKSLVIAMLINGWKQTHPHIRVCVLAHRTYLIEQNADELREFYEGDIGLYSAKLNRRDHCSVMFASIDSIKNRWNEFTFDALLIDEIQYLSPKEGTRYQTFIDGCKRINKHVRVIGLTATPYRLNGGSICGEHSIMTKIVYRANVGDLIEQGYLCPLRSKVTAKLDLSEVKKTANDYNLKALSEAIDQDYIVQSAVDNMINICIAEKRKAIIVFCIDVAHAKHVTKEIRLRGYDARCVTSHQGDKECDRLIAEFKNQEFPFFVSVNKFLEGFNAKHIDCIAMMRPTKSKGLWIQAVGRGLRLHPSKDNCLILDYGNNIAEHGCIDDPPNEKQRVRVCEECEEVFSQEVRVCPSCGWEVPKREIQREQAEAKERERLHEIQAAQEAILRKQQEPTWYSVNLVTVSRHRKEGSPDSLKVTYISGVNQFCEWVCLDHEGYAGAKAKEWMIKRGLQFQTINDCFQEMFLQQMIKDRTEQICVQKEGKHFKITDHKLINKTISYDER